jgi:SAM-dependent methyltransferase
VPLEADAETRLFLERARARPHGAVALGARALLTRFVSDFDANGFLGVHGMHVLSTGQWRRLLGGAVGGALLDVGAGDGAVTATLAPLVDRVVTTELSGAMVRRQRARGFRCHRVDLAVEPLPEPGPFELVTALNVLDRCARPLSLLARLVSSMAPGGRLVIAAPLPLSAHVHVGPMTIDPEELLPVEGEGFEAQASALYARVLAPAGLELVAFARAPYLCRGGRARPVISLDDALFVLRRPR